MVAVGSCARSAPAGKPAPAPNAPLRIVTWNIHECESGVAAIADELARLDADVICLQEAVRSRPGGRQADQAREIADRRGMDM